MDAIKVNLLILLGSYILLSILAFLGGMLEGGQDTKWQRCYHVPNRVEQFFPTNKLGCWLAQPIDQPYYDYESKKQYELSNKSDVPF